MMEIEKLGEELVELGCNAEHCCSTDTLQGKSFIPALFKMKLQSPTWIEVTVCSSKA